MAEARKRPSLFTTISGPALQSTLPPNQCEPQALCWG